MSKVLLVTAIAAMTCSAALAQSKPLSGEDVNLAARTQDKRAQAKVVGKQVALTLTPRPKTVYFEFPEDPGIVVVCPQNSGFTGGRVTSKVSSLQFDVDDGHEFVNVLKLESCK